MQLGALGGLLGLPPPPPDARLPAPDAWYDAAALPPGSPREPCEVVNMFVDEEGLDDSDEDEDQSLVARLGRAVAF